MNPVREFCSSLPSETIFHGGHTDNDTQIILKAGNLTMILENGALRYISIGKTEVIRMIYFALRDINWLTIKPEIHYVKSEINEESFHIVYDCNYTRNDIKFSAEFSIEGKPDTSIFFRMEGEAMGNFKRNRIGFCVLHPLEDNTGNPCTVIHTDGTVENMIFPDLISPHQPFLSIKSFKWRTGKVDCIIDYSGEIFETEDQRNWTDSSFKTYSTPLSIPFPVVVEKGTKISQSILLKLDGEITGDTNPDGSVKIEVFPDERFVIPHVGVSRSSRNIKLSPSETDVLKKVRFDNYRVELHLFEKSWKSVADEAVEESDGLGSKLEFALIFDDDFINQAADFLQWVYSKGSLIGLISLFHNSKPVTPEDLSRKVIPMIKKVLPKVKTATGTNANFVQLNRNRPGDNGSDSICYSIHPQEHASDNSTLVENLAAQAHTIRSAKSFSRGKRIIVSPVTIQRRFNANKAYYEIPSEDNQMDSRVDSRLMSLFGACWTAGSLKYLIESGADSITYFETAGERGIIQGDSESRWPGEFHSTAGMIFPVFHVLRFINSSKSFRVIKTKSSDPLKVESLVMSDGKRSRIVLVNFTGTNQTVVPFQLEGQFIIREMNETNFPEVVSDQSWLDEPCKTGSMSHDILILSPFSVTFIDGLIKL